MKINLLTKRNLHSINVDDRKIRNELQSAMQVPALFFSVSFFAMSILCGKIDRVEK